MEVRARAAAARRRLDRKRCTRRRQRPCWCVLLERHAFRRAFRFKKKTVLSAVVWQLLILSLQPLQRLLWPPRNERDGATVRRHLDRHRPANLLDRLVRLERRANVVKARPLRRLPLRALYGHRFERARRQILVCYHRERPCGLVA